MKIMKYIRKCIPNRILPEKWTKEPVVIPVVRMVGPIMVNQGGPMRSHLNMASIAGPLQKAFDMKEARAVAISINSPGGSPVQSRLIHERIRQLAAEKEKEVIVFCEDAAASGGYMIAVAGDVIIADPSSIVGSIGVVSGGFGFVNAIEKLGIERRVYTAGTQKAMLDPFKPENPEHLAHLNELLQDLFESFKDLVRRRRGDKLTETEDKLFTGAFWTGNKALDYGLVDELGGYQQLCQTPLRGGHQAQADFSVIRLFQPVSFVQPLHGLQPRRCCGRPVRSHRRRPFCR